MEIELVNVGDLLESPVLFISGKGSMQLTTKQKTVLQQYVNQGGFLFVENACGDAQFDQEFRLLMKELFPDSPLAPLAPLVAASPASAPARAPAEAAGAAS